MPRIMQAGPCVWCAVVCVTFVLSMSSESHAMLFVVSRMNLGLQFPSSTHTKSAVAAGGRVILRV